MSLLMKLNNKKIYKKKGKQATKKKSNHPSLLKGKIHAQ